MNRFHVLGPEAVFRDDFIHDAICLRLLRRHDEIALHVLVDFFKRLSRVAGEEIVERCAGADDLFRMDIDVGGLAGEGRTSMAGAFPCQCCYSWSMTLRRESWT